MIRTASELRTLQTFEERYEYLRLGGRVGEETFGFERHHNQRFYTSRDWRQVRHHVIARDLGCDLGFPEREIFSGLLIHHINPMTLDDILEGNPMILDPENLITTKLSTHNAIHYGDVSKLERPYEERRPGDTTLWGPVRVD